MHKLTILLLVALACLKASADSFSGYTVADEGAWCWFADPRALHYQNTEGTINATYLGYIDVHGNIKATQYNWLTGRKTDVLIRSNFQPDDHDNPTFLVLPDERVMIFYTRHTDEPKIWYRISTQPGDITELGPEKYLATANNTTYPSPFILSDDPTHIYLCWRGINWHPTIARITMPDSAGNTKFDFGPKQIVQSTGARPYAKYQSNGKDKIYVSYTTGHPDNEYPDWLYLNVIDINKGNGPLLRSLDGTLLSTIANGAFNVNKTTTYAQKYPNTIVDNTASVRNWLWQIVTDENGYPVVAYPHIDNAKTTHTYYYARWNGKKWVKTQVAQGGHAFHQNWNNTERCYSGGMAIDPDSIGNLYLSIPTTNGTYNKNGVYEIWKYTIDENGTVTSSQPVTYGSEKNNVRPFVLPGSAQSDMRLAWMHGDYYYWMVNKNYPKGYPTGIRTHYNWVEATRTLAAQKALTFGDSTTMSFVIKPSASRYYGNLLKTADGSVVYRLDPITHYPVWIIDGKEYASQNRLYTSDDWATQSSGTSGDSHPTKVSQAIITLTYDGSHLTVYRNALVDQVISTRSLKGLTLLTAASDIFDTCTYANAYAGVATPAEVKTIADAQQQLIDQQADKDALKSITLPAETRTDLVLPATVNGRSITWKSGAESVLSSTGAIGSVAQTTTATLTARAGSSSKVFMVKVLKRDITKNVLCTRDTVDLTTNGATTFSTNKYELLPQGLLSNLRSYTVLLKANANSVDKLPRFYDFGSGSSNSMFLRVKPLSAGIKYNGGSTTMVTASTTLATHTDYLLAVSYSAATGVTTIYLDGKPVAADSNITAEPWQLVANSADTRNYIGRTQWWDTNVKNDNADFSGLITQFAFYNVALTQSEINKLQGTTQIPDANDIITTVNDTWQQRNPTHGNYFWNRAVYQIGNLEAYKATQNTTYKDFAEAWAERNKWSGPTDTYKAGWTYTYGEGGNHVLFGDNQVCFQVYTDLFNLDGATDSTKIARALDVMNYEISTATTDYIWWVDGMFMVLPVMPRLYAITGNADYLSSMYSYWKYAHNLMWDDDAGLYYRDRKYIYPEHTTLNGKKDFWARGNGWAFATYARMLDQLPATDAHRAEYVTIFKRMAAALKASQQEEGYWTRSIGDSAYAPGYETSGTALITYGLAWGIRNGLLNRFTYGDVLAKAWGYLCDVALQANGTVGYIQPIGENASPDQTLSASSYYDFGVGAFLMAAAEITRYQKYADGITQVTTREKTLKDNYVYDLAGRRYNANTLPGGIYITGGKKIYKK